MSLNQEKIRLLFGLKLKQIRLDQGFTPLELSKRSGISISYLNEIEKGKKYPKAEKIEMLSKVLGVNYTELASLEVENKLSALRLLLDSNFIQDIPFDFFGIDPSVLFEMLAGSPLHFSTFVNSISRIGKNYNLDMGQFYYAILKSFQEVHYYYFPEIELEAENFKIFNQFKIIGNNNLSEFLNKNLELELMYFDGDKNKDLKYLRSHFNPKSQVLSVNKSLHLNQKNFIFAREIGFKTMELKKRPLTYNYVKIKSFEEILNNFKASYFAAAVLIDKNILIEKISHIFQKNEFDIHEFTQILISFETTAETFIQRLLTVLLNDFGIRNIAFFKFESQKNGLNPRMVKDLHLNKRHYPQETSTEAYCKRWIAIQSLQDVDLNKTSQAILVQHQFTEYIEEKRKYWHLTIAGKTRNNFSLTLSIEITQDAIEKISFLKGNKSHPVHIGQTCERCSIFDCKERKSAPTILQKNRSEEAFDETIKKYF
jgi:XRE family transcriptional regulator, fatty acid utilization regulator